MKIREDLIFDETNGQITGFVDYGDSNPNNCFAKLKKECQHQLNLNATSVVMHRYQFSPADPILILFR